jgi:small multidrug resistance family-3 protein
MMVGLGTVLQALLLFVLTALAEVSGSYLVYLVVKQGKPPILLIPAALLVMCFIWLLTLHPGAAGRTYAAYGGVYVAIAIVWMWIIEHKPANMWEIAGVTISLIGMGIIVLAPHH